MIAQILLFLFFLCEHWNSGIFTDLCKSGQSILGRVQIPCHDLSFQILHSCHPQSPTKAEYLLLLINRFVLATFPSISSEPNITFLKPRLISFLLSTTKKLYHLPMKRIQNTKQISIHLSCHKPFELLTLSFCSIRANSVPVPAQG